MPAAALEEAVHRLWLDSLGGIRANSKMETPPSATGKHSRLERGRQRERAVEFGFPFRFSLFWGLARLSQRNAYTNTASIGSQKWRNYCMLMHYSARLCRKKVVVSVGKSISDKSIFGGGETTTCRSGDVTIKIPSTDPLKFSIILDVTSIFVRTSPSNLNNLLLLQTF